MKIIIYIFIFGLLASECGAESKVSKDIDSKEKITTVLENRNEIAFLPKANEPFTGKYETYYPNGQKQVEANYKNGKKNGLETEWREDGQKIIETNYEDGKINGLETLWSEDGRKKIETSYKDGQETNEPIQEIKNRCQTKMAEYGAAMVKTCEDQNIEAFNALDSYMKNHEAIVIRCLDQLKEQEYVMVKACIDQDIGAEDEAKDALRKY